MHLIVGSAGPQRRPHDAMGLVGGKDLRGYFISGKAEPRPRSLPFRLHQGIPDH
jgi:hypothetical protein